MNNPEFWGSLLGPVLGLVAILLGALYNACLNRKRDDRLREIDIRNSMVVLYSDLNNIFDIVYLNFKLMGKEKNKEQLKRFYILLQSPILESYHQMISDIAPEIASLIHARYSKIKSLSIYLQTLTENGTITDDDFSEIQALSWIIMKPTNGSNICGELAKVYSLLVEYGHKKDEDEDDRLNHLSEEINAIHNLMGSNKT